MFATKFAIRLDKSVKLSDNTHPIVLQVTFDRNVRRKRLGLNASFDQWDFEDHEFRKGVHERWKKNQQLEDAEKRARKIYRTHFEDRIFNYVKFLELFTANTSDEIKVIEFCMQVSEKFLQRQQACSSNDYKYLANAIRKISPKDLLWSEFNEDWLYGFEDYFTSRGTRCFSHMKLLRALYNKAVKARIVDFRKNPFKNSYTNPYGYEFSRLKKSKIVRSNNQRIKDLSKDQLIKLKTYSAITPKEQEYLDIWWFSFYMFGVNLTDIAQLKWSHIRDGRWFYQRSKTGTGLKKGKPILPEAMEIMERNRNESEYVFTILTNGYDADALTITNRIKHYSSNMRKASTKISKRIKLEGYYTFYSARYSSATLALNEGADRNTVSHLLDHENFSTIDNYAGRADDLKVVEVMEILRL